MYKTMTLFLIIAIAVAAQIGLSEVEKAGTAIATRPQLKKAVEYNADSTVVIARGYVDPEGVREGGWRFYDSTGALLHKGSYKKGNKTGKWLRLGEKGDTVSCIMYTPNGDSVDCSTR